VQEEASIREHIRALTEQQLKDAQAEHEQTQQTVRAGDSAEDAFVRRTRPGQSWLSLVAALVYVGYCTILPREIDSVVLSLLLTLPWAYAGLRQVGKGMETMAAARAARG
jgi:hypothetical protein